MADPRYDFDFAVAGGGPAGSSAAISLGQRGHSVVLFERDTFPRFHIGESLLSTANDAFAALGVRNTIETACFPEKWGARLYTHDGQSGRYVDFTEVREVTRAQTFQVCREEFDRILLERAREIGVEVRENCNVSACEFSADAAILECRRLATTCAPSRVTSSRSRRCYGSAGIDCSKIQSAYRGAAACQYRDILPLH